MCPPENVPNSQHFWNEVNNPGDQLYVSHRYRCLDEYKHYVTRKCEPSGWVPELQDITCFDSIDEEIILTTCPPEYEPMNGKMNDIRLCVHISVDQQPWTDTCLKSGSYSAYDLSENDAILLNKHIDQEITVDTTDVWLPASKIWFTNAMFRIENQIQWNLAAAYGRDDNPPIRYEIDDTFRTGGGCLKNIRSSGKNVVTECNENHYHLCLYGHEMPTMLAMSCKSGYQTTRHSLFQNICIGIRKFASFNAENVNDDSVQRRICDNENVFGINSGYTLHIFRELAETAKLTESDRCLFNIIADKKTVTKADWEIALSEGRSDVKFFNWALETTFVNESETISPILATKSNGEWVWAYDINCAICFFENDIKLPTMNFQAFHQENTLFLRVTHVSSLWRETEYRYADGISCFTLIYGSKDASRIKAVVIIHQNEMVSESLYKLSTNDEGWYWCTGLRMGTFETIKTEIRLGIVKFAIIGRTMSHIRETTLQLEPHIITDEILDMWNDTNTSIFHVYMSITTSEYLTFEDNLLNLSDPMLAAYYVQQKLYNATNSTLSFNSTEYCLPSSIGQLNEINFPGCRLEHYATSIELCLLPSQLPITKQCIGDSLFGGMWNDDVPIPKCHNNLQSDVTQKLHNLLYSNDKPDRIVNTMIHIVLDTCSECLNGADIFYISQFMKSFEDFMSNSALNNALVTDIFQLYDRLLMINDTVANNAASLNATNALLNSLDVFLIKVAKSKTGIENGIRSIIQPMLTSFVIDPSTTNVTGVAMISNGTASNLQWNNYTIRYLYRNQTVADILNIPNLIIASYLPDILIDSLANPNNPQLPFTISFFMNDVLFKANNADSVIEPSIKSNGKILSIILPIETSNLEFILPIFIKPYNDTFSNNVCGFWNFSNNIDGWSTNGCMQNDNVPTSTAVLCECTHLTHFAYLFNGYDGFFKIPSHHLDKLEIVTIIGCSFSLAGILIIFLTALLFKKWRNSSSSKVLLQFSAAIGFEMGMVLFVNTEANTNNFVLKNQTLACIAFGVLTHYFVIATFFWMLIIGYMQLMRYVVVFHTFDSRFVVKSSLLAWGLPIIIIVLVLSIHPNAYLRNNDDFRSKICYPSGYALYFGVMAPISLITLANLLIFVLVVKSLVTKNNEVRSHHDKSIVLSQLRLSIFLFFSLGLTWIFAFLSMTDTSYIFSYLFSLTSTMQGFILFFYFILLDPISRELWKNFMLNKLCNFVHNK